MSENSPSKVYRPTMETYVAGFVLSLVFTLVAYLLVRDHLKNNHLHPSDTAMMISLAVLALSQLLVQLRFFLHLGRETKPRWNLLVFFFMLLTVFIIVGGSLWIMHNLSYRMMPDQINQYLKEQDGGI